MAIVFDGAVRGVGANRLRYIVSSPDGVAATLVLPNANGPSPDLRLDASGPLTTRLAALVATAVAVQADARKLLNGEDLFATAADMSKARGYLRVIPRTGAAAWSVDANEGAAAGNAPSAGFGVVVISYGGGLAGDSCIVEVQEFQSIDQSVSGI